MSARVRRKQSNAMKGLLRVLPRFARGEIAAETATEIAPIIQKAMRSQLKPHRRTGAAEDKAKATASGTTIILYNVGYAKFIDKYYFARRFPTDFVQRIKRVFRGKVRRELRRTA